MSMLLMLFLHMSLTSSRWQESSRPKMVVDYLKQHHTDMQSFLGNQTHADHFKLLNQDGKSLLIGARNFVYNISLEDLTENIDQRIEWSSRYRDKELCLVKGKSEDDCNNYIRVLAKQDNESILVCGTNSYNPRCRSYVMNEDKVYEVARDYSGKGYCPYDPTHNSTFLFTDGQFYSGTVSDFSGSDSLIIRGKWKNGQYTRTGQYNLNHLNSPDFVGSVEDDDYVYFFFREEAIENMNCAKEIFSRVGRVCKKDFGFRNKWTSFSKTRLNCSVPGQYPFYFNQIQSISPIIKSPGEEELIFGVFNTPENSISGSAVCSYKMSEIRNSFDGLFKVQQDVNSNWLPLPRQREPSPRPGCSRNSEHLSDEYLNFIRDNVLLDQAVPMSIHTPHFVKTSPDERLTTVTVDIINGNKILFVGTSRGRILKMVMSGQETSFIEEIQLFPQDKSVGTIQIIKEGVELGKIVAMSQDEVKSISVARCSTSLLLSCVDCLKVQDPYCGWSLGRQKCVNINIGEESSDTVRDIHSCPSLYLDIFGQENVGITSEDYDDVKGQNLYTERSLGMACSSAAVVSLVIGMMCGFLISKRMNNQSYLNCGHHYLEAHGTKWYPDDKSSFLSPSAKNNLLANNPQKSDPMKTNIPLTKNNVRKKMYI